MAAPKSGRSFDELCSTEFRLLLVINYCVVDILPFRVLSPYGTSHGLTVLGDNVL